MVRKSVRVRFFNDASFTDVWICRDCVSTPGTARSWSFSFFYPPFLSPLINVTTLVAPFCLVVYLSASRRFLLDFLYLTIYLYIAFVCVNTYIYMCTQYRII